MIVGLGLDIVEIPRILRLLQRFGAAFTRKILHPIEQQHLPAGPQASAYVAARFAAKEAAVKALGTGFAQGIGMQHIAVHNEPSGQPILLLYGPAAARMADLGATRAYLSLTHGRDTAAAVVILEV
ncbi:MAG: holo-[acyl-carrier-protein] synthase [Desulfovibrionaceae bacterium]